MTRKKRGSALEAATLEQPAGPTFLVVEEAHRRDDVQEHPGRHEAPDPARVGAGDALDVLDDVAEAAAHDLADLRVLAGDIALQLHEQLLAVAEEVAVCVC